MSTKINNSITSLFMEAPGSEFHLREIARKTRISPRTAKKYLSELVKDGILKRRKERMHELYATNADSQAYRDMRIYYNIRRIRECGLIDYINKELSNPVIVFFGSASKGRDSKKSDIDLCVVTKSKKELEMDEFQQKLGKEIQIFVFTEIKKSRENAELLNSILNGIVLSGFLEVF